MPRGTGYGARGGGRGGSRGLQLKHRETARLEITARRVSLSNKEGVSLSLGSEHNERTSTRETNTNITESRLAPFLLTIHPFQHKETA